MSSFAVMQVTDQVSPQLLRSDKPVVILPFYGEFGWFLLSYVRMVHYFEASQKIVCCHRGDESYFPSATAFYYDWKDLFDDSARQGFRNEWPIAAPRRVFAAEQELKDKLTQLYADHDLVRFDYPIPLHLLKYFPMPVLDPQTSIDTQVDIVVCARRRLTPTRPSDQERNYPHWLEILQPLVDQGYSVGMIGKRETSFSFDQITTAAWEFPHSTDAMISMLQNSRLYIGTDTGPTHLATLLRRPQIVFRYEGDAENPDLLRAVVQRIAQHEGFYVKIVDNAWTQPNEVVHAAIKYLDYAFAANVCSLGNI